MWTAPKRRSSGIGQKSERRGVRLSWDRLLLVRHLEIIMFFLLAFLACATQDADDATSPFPEHDDDSASPTSVDPANGGLLGHVETGDCAQGEIIELDFGTAQVFGYQVEVKYADGTFEPMQPSIHIRSSIAMIDGSLADYESPIYRNGPVLTFTCGYQWESTGPRIEGVQTGTATGYRVTWMTEQ